MASYKQIILDIKDYISFETAQLEHLLEKELPLTMRQSYEIEKITLKDISDIIKEGGK
jgi:hypothetical protein